MISIKQQLQSRLGQYLAAIDSIIPALILHNDPPTTLPYVLVLSLPRIVVTHEGFIHHNVNQCDHGRALLTEDCIRCDLQ